VIRRAAALIGALGGAPVKEAELAGVAGALSKIHAPSRPR
jgi:hypothetical protein